MKRPTTKLAVAVGIIIVILLVIYFTVDSIFSDKIWADVIKNIEANTGFSYRTKQVYRDNERGEQEYIKKTYGSPEFGIRIDNYENSVVNIQTYASIKDKTLISVIHPAKTYNKKALSDNDLADIEEYNLKDAIRKLLSTRYKKLGRKKINGIEAEGIKITDPKAGEANFPIESLSAQFWVSVKTGLPILYEGTTIGKKGKLELNTVQDEFEWNIKLDAGFFEPDIPEDYTEMN